MRALRDEMDLPIGTRGDPFARWEVIQDDYERAPAGIIGSGATAVVLMVRDRADPKRLAALKKIPLRHPLALSYSGTTPRSAVRQELHVLRHLSRGAAQHSGVARLIEAYEHEGCAYLALELCGGGDLFTAANRMIATKTRWSEDALRSIARELLAALAHTHALGVAHRDVKPENVLFRDARGARCGRGVVLSDFGTATVVAAEHEGALLRRCRSESFDSAVSSECEELERNDTANGTPLFLAPELMPLFRSDERSRRLMPRALLAMAEGVRRRASSGERGAALAASQSVRLAPPVVPRQPGDVWGVGSVLYICALLRMPSYDARGAVDVDAPLDARLGFGDEARAPAGLRDLIKRLLAVEADERPSAAEALEHPWLCQRGARQRSDAGGGGGRAAEETAWDEECAAPHVWALLDDGDGDDGASGDER